MEKIILCIYPILLLVLTFFGAKRSKKGEFSDDFLQLEQTKLIQGFACIAVIIHHITQQITKYGTYNKGPITDFNNCGIIFTAIFFFCSGYGLVYSVYNKENYLRSFLTKRLPTVLIPFWLINILGVLLMMFGFKVRYTVPEVLCYIFGIMLINSNGWFIIEIAILYIFFYIFFKLIKKKDIALVFTSIATVLVIIFSYHQGHETEWFGGEWWFNSTITFAFGMIFARFKDGITAFCKKHYKAVLIVTVILLDILLNAGNYMVARYGYYVESLSGLGKYGKPCTLLVQMAECIVFVMFVILLNLKIKLGNKALKFISGISVELFLIHGYFVNIIFAEVRMGDVLRYVVNFACAIAFTAVVSPMIRWVVKKTVELLNTKKTYNDTLEAEIIRRENKKKIKKLKIAVAVIAVAGTLLWLVINFSGYLFGRKIHEKERQALINSNVGDEVKWGRFETNGSPGRETWEWIVIRKTDDMVCLLSKQGVAGCWYNQKSVSVTWEDSDIRKLINGKEYINSFNKYEFADMVPVGDDYITLLTVDEVLKVFDKDEDRELSITDLAQMEGTNINTMSKVNNWDMKGYRSSWWWLRERPGVSNKYAPIVTVDGRVFENGKEVNRTGGAIRPVIWVKCGKTE